MKYSRNFYEIKSNDEIFKKISSEVGKVGYLNLIHQDFSKVNKYAKSIKQNNIVLIGIGGSSLGVKAIYNFLITSNSFNKKLIFLDTIDPLKIKHELSLFSLNDAHFFIISKSGNTVEPISIFKYISSRVRIDSSNCTAISEKNSALDKFASNKKIKSFYIDKNVGGRFSVFSVAGLLPLSSVGVNIEELIKGCSEVQKSFFEKGYYYDHIINKARFLVENKARFNNNVIFSYSSIFQCFNKWFVQLWAESLGKKNVNGTRQGLTPITLIGPEDQHSFLQLLIDGPRDKTITFFKIENLGDDSKIPSDNDFNVFKLDYLDNITFNELINFQADATVESILEEKDIPCDVISIPTVDEYNIAILMFRYQMLVSCIGAFLQINAYDQPGVEKGKLILKQKLKK